MLIALCTDEAPDDLTGAVSVPEGGATGVCIAGSEAAGDGVFAAIDCDVLLVVTAALGAGVDEVDI